MTDVAEPTAEIDLHAEIERLRAQVAVLTARAETAVVRTLANAARVLDASPALAQLRLVQSVPYGAQVKLQLPTPRTEAE